MAQGAADCKRESNEAELRIRPAGSGSGRRRLRGNPALPVVPPAASG
jgi:hypothetical protein